ncbi:hypothetical protein B9Z55_012328 [Caenorhabditis nigoni]|nr:hypothetical protein B9Z55_012328 [Caenorhabditis nigoni]
MTLGFDNQIRFELSTDPGVEWVIKLDRWETSVYPCFQSDLSGPKLKHNLLLNYEIDEFKKMAENIWEVFDSSVYIINTFEESLMEWIINTQPIVRNVYMLGGVITSFEMLNRIFTSVEVTQYFHLNAIARVKKTKFMEPIPYRAITIDNSYWFSLPSILNGSNSIIRLHDSTLTPTDINTILREWQMGTKLRNLEYLEIWTSTRLDRERSAREMYKDLNNLTDGDESDGRPRTVIVFSLLSKRAKSIAKQIHWDLLDIRLKWSCYNQIRLKIPSDPKREWIIEHHKRKEASEYPYVESKKYSGYSYHYLFFHKNQNAVEELEQIFETIWEVFRSPICDFPVVEKSVINWLIEFQPTIRCAWICDNVLTASETLESIFKSLKVTQYFRLKTVEADIQTKITEPIPYRSISIGSSYLVTLPAILNGNNSIILLDGSELTPMDINTILKEWQKGTKLRNLEFLEIKSSALQEGFDGCVREISKDLNLTESDENDGRPRKVKIHDEWEYWLPNVNISYNLVRSDGMIGSIFPTYRLHEDGRITDIRFNLQNISTRKPRKHQLLTEVKAEEESKTKNGFPLLNLPRVVLLECIENLEVLEIVQLSLLSKRAKSAAKLNRWDLMGIQLILKADHRIYLKIPSYPMGLWNIEYRTKKTSECPYKMLYAEAFHYFYSIEELKQMIEHLYEVFRSPTCDFRIVEQSMVEWLIKFQPTIRYIRFLDGVITSFETLNRICESLKGTEYFYLGSVRTYEKTEVTEPIPYRAIAIDNSYWLTLPAILNGTNSIILLDGSELTPKDINTILKEWQMGCKLRNLEYLEIKSSKLQDLQSYTNEVLKDLNVTTVVGNDGRAMTIKVTDDFIHRLPQVQIVHNLIRNDGMIGSIFPSKRKNELLFNFQVWRRET